MRKPGCLFNERRKCEILHCSIVIFARPITWKIFRALQCSDQYQVYIFSFHVYIKVNLFSSNARLKSSLETLSSKKESTSWRLKGNKKKRERERFLQLTKTSIINGREKDKRYPCLLLPTSNILMFLSWNCNSPRGIWINPINYVDMEDFYDSILTRH